MPQSDRFRKIVAGADEDIDLVEAALLVALLAVGLWPKSISTAVDRALPAPVAAKTTRADNAASPSAR